MSECERCRFLMRECLDCKLLRLEKENGELRAQLEAERKTVFQLGVALGCRDAAIDNLRTQLEQERKEKNEALAERDRLQKRRDEEMQHRFGSCPPHPESHSPGSDW